MRHESIERLASVEQRLTDHEARCEERLGDPRAAIGERDAVELVFDNRLRLLRCHYRLRGT